MVLEVPTVQIESNAPTMLQGGSIQQMSDEKSAPLKQLAKGQMQLGQQISNVAQKLQDERDDAVYTQKHNEYIAKVNETKLNFASLEGENAIKIVGYDENDDPITVLDQTKADLTKLSEEFEESLENNTQKLLFKTKAASTLNSANMFMTKHEITEFQGYRDNEFLNEIDIIADTTGQNYEDWHDGSGEFSKHKAISLLLASRYADNKGWPENSSQRAGLIQKVINKINVSTLNQMISKKDFDDAKAYLDSETNEGRVDAATYNTYASKILTGYNKQKGEIKANAILTDRGDTNSGSYTDKANKLFSLDSFNHTDDGTGRTVKYGFRPDEIDTSQLNESDAKEFLEQVQNTSKYYQEDSGLSLLPQHQTIHLFAGKHLGIKKADSYFSKAKSELKKSGVDKDSDGYNEKLIDLVIGYTNEDMVNKIGADNPFATMVANDLQILKSDINYDYDPNDGPSYKVDEKTKMPLLVDLKKKLKDTIQDEDQLTYALAELERNYKEEKKGKEEIYDANLEAAQEIAYSDKDGWTKLADNGIDIEDFTREDQLLLRNGHSEKSDTNTILFLDKNPEVVADINKLNKYRGKLTQSDYLEYVEESKKLQAGGTGSVLEAKVDADIFDTALKDYGFEKLLKNTDIGSDYRDVRLAVKEEINKRQTQKGSKLSFKEKQDAVAFVLNDKILMQGKGKQIFPLGAVDEDEYQKAYVKVGNKKVFLRAINKYQRKQIVQSFIDSGKGRPTEQQIAEYWIREGMPRETEKGDKTPKYNKNGDIVSSDTGTTRKYVQTFNIMG
tara:strand:- start:9500 stop:11860 length:2361 start_codon:yes stop_codon:yes gene_type:complete